MNNETFLHNIIRDLRVELTDEFDRNFERKAFFDTPWALTAHSVSRGSLLLRTGDLRKSLESKIQSNSINFSSSLPYASIHNEGGTLTVTAAMKRYFWAMYYKAAGGAKKGGKTIKGSSEANYFKSLALMKVGSKMVIPKRQFIGHQRETDRMVRQVVNDNVQDLARELGEQLRRFQ